MCTFNFEIEIFWFSTCATGRCLCPVILCGMCKCFGCRGGVPMGVKAPATGPGTTTRMTMIELLCNCS